jgi:hypothetical protein
MSKFLFLLTDEIPSPWVNEVVNFKANSFFYIESIRPALVSINLNLLFRIWQFHHEHN